MKQCSQCKEIKEDSCFVKSKKTLSGLASECKECKKKYLVNKEYHKEYYALNKESINKKHRNNHLFRNYGITIEEYEDLKEKQNNKCAICGCTPTRSYHVDHCHYTGEVRGLLCNNCNAGIGKLQDNVNILEKAIKYLQNPPAKDKE
jgi:hypothetical protein